MTPNQRPSFAFGAASVSRVSVTICLTIIFLLSVRAVSFAQTQEDTTLTDNKVHVEVLPYLVIPGMSGEVTVRGISSQSINTSNSGSGTFSNLQFGFMARTGVSYNRWFAGTDTVYMGLGGSSNLVNAGFDEWVAELNGGYRVHPRIAVLAAVRYNNLSTDLKLKGPLQTHFRASQVWWDPVLGGVGNIPIGKKFNLSARLDVGGFGAGSRIAVNAEPIFNWRFNKRLAGLAGWKFFYQDYVNSADKFEYDVLTQGPLLGLAIHW